MVDMDGMTLYAMAKHVIVGHGKTRLCMALNGNIHKSACYGLVVILQGVTTDKARRRIARYDMAGNINCVSYQGKAFISKHCRSRMA
jgi:hypothetical protein